MTPVDPETSKGVPGGYYNVAAVKAEADRQWSGRMSDVPQTPRMNTLKQPVVGRISELASAVTEAGHMLQDARDGYQQACERKAKCEAAFAQTAEALMKALHEHREGTPEGVSYQR